MRVVVADASPLHYLILIDAVQVLPRIFETIHIPVEVRDELVHQETPAAVREWMQQAPKWLEIQAAPSTLEDPALDVLDFGERAAILLAEAISADLVLIDERAGAKIAQRRGLEVTGTLGVLKLASKAGLLPLREAFERLRSTNFRYPVAMVDRLLEDESNR